MDRKNRGKETQYGEAKQSVSGHKVDGVSVHGAPKVILEGGTPGSSGVQCGLNPLQTTDCKFSSGQ
jgi:hypothetical protein